MHLLRRSALLALLVIVPACASRGAPRAPYYRPTVAVQEVKFAGVGLTGGAVDIVLAIHNPNEYALHSPRVTYRLSIDDVHLASGSYRYDDIVIGVGDSARVRLPVSFSYTSLGMRSRAVMNRGTMDYRVAGELSVYTTHGRYSSSYDRWGRIAPMLVRGPR